MKSIIKTFLLLLITTLNICLTACGNDNNDEPNSSTNGEWYVTPDGFASSYEFQEIITAIDNHELLSDYGKNRKHYAEIDEFIRDDGSYSDSSANKGRLRFWIKQNPVNIIHIVDNMTAEFYVAWLYTDLGENNQEGDQRIWHFNAGSYFGKMAYYTRVPSNLIYQKNNNTYVFSDGKVFIMKPDGLQGDGGLWKKFTPKF